MRYIVFVLSLFIAPALSMFINIMAVKFLSPVVNEDSDEFALLSLNKRMVLVSLLLIIAFGAYSLKYLNLIQLLMSIAIISCIIIMKAVIQSNDVIYLNENGFYKKNKEFSDEELTHVNLIINYDIEDDKKGAIKETGLLNLALDNKGALYSNFYSFSKNIKPLKCLKSIHKYKNIQYSINNKDFNDFDEAFVYMINNSSKDKSLIAKNKNKFMELYKLINPNGDYNNLKISSNYK